MLGVFFNTWLGRDSLIAEDDVWALLAVMCTAVALSIFLEQRYAWAAKVSGVILALVFALILSNLSILPVNSVLYDDIVWGYAVPMGIPLLLLQCNIKKIWKEAGRILIIFLIGALGTFVGAFVAYRLLCNSIPELAGIAAMMTGTYIGGSMNLAALSAEFEVSSTMVGAATVADNLMMAIYFFALILFAGMNFFLKSYKHPYIDAIKSSDNPNDLTAQAAAYWKPKSISIKDIAANFAVCILIVWLSRLIAAFWSAVIPSTNIFLSVIGACFGSQYVWISLVSMLLATYGEKQVKKLHGSQEIGTYLIYLFLFVIGVPASIVHIFQETPLLFVFTCIMVTINMAFCFIGGKLLNFNLEEIIIASNANIGGPTTAAGMAISQGWSSLVGPAMLIGTFGYVLGTYLGVIVGSLLGA